MMFSVLLALAACAPPQEPIPPKLEAILALSIDPGFDDEWIHTRMEHGLKLGSIGEAVCGQRFQVCVLSVGYSTGPKGHVDLHYDVKITRPDGKSYYEKQGFELCVGDGVAEGNVQLAKQGLGVSFDPPDPRGEYMVTVEIHDGVAHASASAKQKISLIEFPETKPFKDADDMGVWLQEYYRSPTPLRALEAIVTAGDPELLGGEEPALGVRMFLRAICAENTFLEPQLLERFPKMAHGARLAALDVIAGTKYDAKPFLAAASEEERKAFEALVKTGNTDPLAGPIQSDAQLQAIWGVFFATGRYAPIERVAKALVLDEKETEELGGKKAAEEVENLVDWSLGSNLDQERVREYCEWMLAHDRLDENDAAALRKLLKP